MKTISPELKSHLSQSVLTIAKCWQLTLNDGKLLGFTDHNKTIIYENQTYNSIIGFENENLIAKSDIDCDKINIISILNSDYITEADIIAGKYDKAKAEIFIINYQDLTMGRVLLFKGFLSDIKCNDGKFFANLKGISSELEKTIGETFSPLCRASFCDNKCKLAVANYTFNGIISAKTNNLQFYSDNPEIKTKPQNYFNYGIITFTSGNNKGLAMEIKQFNSGNFVLAMEMPYNIEVSDCFNAVAGCDKKFKTCCENFNNCRNFRGEPHLPGMEFLLKGY
jgi:uncharacterized phage protein (TIGR02218 family)